MAGLRCDAMAASFVVEGAMDGYECDSHLRAQPAPTIKPCDICHLGQGQRRKSLRAAAAIAVKKARILFL
ncbi:hypothetical protein [Rhizobium sp. BK379]|uniref:hypothetical protein n=1 Tax=Rhizobium sp. BK379 TaxID=2587059 RepID=UPI000372FF63|nr:hypothetical protein [Rhizobium sp. BK379]MBB3444212.1 hypothetical protein [Rhizobium sp. BK379]